MIGHIAIIGAGAVGGFTGGELARSGQDVTLVDPWCEHVDQINRHGLHLTDHNGERNVRVRAITIHEVQGLVRKPVDVAIICTKSYDTEWTAAMIKQYLTPSGFVVSMQNGINEERLASVVGWGKTVGCVLNSINVICFQPGHIRRTKPPGDGSHTVFRVGEVHGGNSARATALADTLSAVDGATVTPNLWGERWTKLIVNSTSHGILGATGLDNRDVYVGRGRPHRLAVRLAAEGITVARAHGFELGTMLGSPADLWLQAASNEAALKEAQANLASWLSRMTSEPSQSSVGRDVARGRRSEIEFTNGYIALKGQEIGVPAPTHAALTDIVVRIDRGELQQDPANLDQIPD